MFSNYFISENKALSVEKR